MLLNKSILSPDAIKLIEEIYGQAVYDINQIKKERDKKINDLLRGIDAKQAAAAIKEIRDLQ
jgi:hypothetical protein